ncbi:RecX family transcriptional regulator [Patescibacteria group bacterium]|nr:RecX family transcriptional regulator [Patescibacteria group bacterium]
MPKITTVELQKKNPHRFNVYLDGQFAFGADDDLLVEYKIISGKEITQQELDKLLFAAEIGKLLEKLYGLLTIRQRSKKEIVDYLHRLSFKRQIKNQDPLSDAVVNQLIQRLEQKALINDLQFAKSWVAARRKSKQKGLQALKTELYQKGISREIIEEVLAQDHSEFDEEILAEQALQKKLKAWSQLPQVDFRKKATEFLLRRGFNYSIVTNLIAKISQKR